MAIKCSASLCLSKVLASSTLSANSLQSSFIKERAPIEDFNSHFLLLIFFQ